MVDTGDAKGPKLHKTVEPDEIYQKTGLAFPHTSHCLASGDLLISCLGDKDGKAEGNGFLLLDENFNVKGRYDYFSNEYKAEYFKFKMHDWILRLFDAS